MKYLSLISLFILSQPQAYTQAYSAILKDKYVSFHVSNDMLNGPYKSYTIKLNDQGDSVKTLFCTGEFKNNLRTGNWILYTESGEIIAERLYTSPFHFENKKPVSTEPIFRLLNQPIYNLKRDSANLYEYFALRERDLAFMRRVWREIRPNNNEQLFSETSNHQLVDAIKNGKFTTFPTDDFNEIVNPSNLPDISDYSIVAYRIKEDFFVDNRRQVSEFRPIGFCPVMKNNKTGEEIEYCWLYYPHIRNLLAQQKLPVSSGFEHLEDLIFMRNLTGSIYDCSALYHCESVKLNDIHPRLFDLELMETEHECWKKFAGYVVKGL
jgi:hypothetical protein